MPRSLYDVYGCQLCEREVVTENGTKKEYVCCDLPMRLVKENTEFEKIDSAEWPADKLVAVLDDEVGFLGNEYMGKTLIATPSIEVKVLSFKSGQETMYEKAGNDISLFMTEGSGILALGYEDLEVMKSSVVIVPRGVLWGIKNNNSSPLVVLQTINKK